MTERGGRHGQYGYGHAICPFGCRLLIALRKDGTFRDHKVPVPHDSGYRCRGSGQKPSAPEDGGKGQ